MKKFIIVSIILLSSIAVYQYIKQNNDPQLIVIEEHKTIDIKENQEKITTPEPLDYNAAQNYLGAGNNWKTR